MYFYLIKLIFIFLSHTLGLGERGTNNPVSCDRHCLLLLLSGAVHTFRGRWRSLDFCLGSEKCWVGGEQGRDISLGSLGPGPDASASGDLVTRDEGRPCPCSGTARFQGFRCPGRTFTWPCSPSSLGVDEGAVLAATFSSHHPPRPPARASLPLKRCLCCPYSPFKIAFHFRLIMMRISKVERRTEC